MKFAEILHLKSLPDRTFGRFMASKFANQRISCRSTIFEGSKTVEFSVGSLIFPLSPLYTICHRQRFLEPLQKAQLSDGAVKDTHVQITHTFSKACLSVRLVCMPPIYADLAVKENGLQ